MKCMIRIFAVSLLLSTTAVSAQSPAEALCKAFQQSVDIDRARGAMEFWNRVDRFSKYTGGLNQNHEECVVSKLSSFSSEVERYCEFRKREGHDLDLVLIDSLENSLSTMSRRCEQAWRLEERKRIAQVRPAKCEDLPASINRLADLLKDERYHHNPLANQIACMAKQLPSHAPAVVEICQNRTIGLDAAQIELEARLIAACESK